MPEMLVRLKRGKKTYEVMVQEGMVVKFRDGSVSRIDDVVVTPVIFLNASKGTKASADQLKDAFQTDDVNTILDLILKKGEAQESAGERKEKLDSKRQEILTTIQKNYVAPDGRPLPMARIQNALDQIKPRIDVDVEAQRQVTAMFAKLSAAMPMKKSAGGMEGTITVPTKLSGSVSSVIRKHATVQRETYGAQTKFEIEIHAYDLLMKDLARTTKGDFEFSLAGQPSGSVAPATPDNAQPSGGKKKGRKKK